ncbi:MAG: NfeD family protein [Deltaproteobacteria bacterium]|jgi:membrane protein implicated in regulation of membrane protease activity|nr:NfeD family protein [Deltaproteobacteria bacterium]
MPNFLDPILIWFLAGLFLILAEFVIPGVIIIFFGIGAWITTILLWLFGFGINLQLFIFISTSLILLLVLRKWLKNIFHGQEEVNLKPGENMEDIMGKEVMVTEDFHQGRGKVKFRGAEWDARSEKDLKKGTWAKIIDKESITFIVE